MTDQAQPMNAAEIAAMLRNTEYQFQVCRDGPPTYLVPDLSMQAADMLETLSAQLSASEAARVEAEARAEDAAKIEGSAGVRIQDVAQYLIDHMPDYNFEHPCWEALQDATNDGADEDDCIRAWLRSIAQIGAKP